jgi:hypothetical protein
VEDDEDQQQNNAGKLDAEIKVHLDDVLAEDEPSGPINLADLRISMPHMKDDFKESMELFE